MAPSLSNTFNQKYEGGRSGFQSPDDRPENLEQVQSLSPRWQQLWMLEELLGVELEIWDKNRAKLNTNDIEEILNSTLESLDAVPVIVENLIEENKEEVKKEK
jgi:hypothetical protein